MKMYAYQDTLPRLPLPALEESSQKLLEWSAVFLSEKELSLTREAVQAFTCPPGSGPLLQKKLEIMALDPNIPNWLEDFWADTYLCNPAPLTTGSNVTFILDKNQRVKHLPIPEFLTSLIFHLLPFHQQILDESLSVDFQGKRPLCMSQYKTLMATTRIPGEVRDSHLTDPNSRHIILIHKGHYYRVQVLDEKRERIDAAALLHQFRSILEAPKTDNLTSPGLLTSLPRRKWATLRSHLLELSPYNKTSLEEIEKALAVFIIDDQEPESESELFKHFFCSNPANRWYDKSLQFILNDNGDLGINYEHSGVDGTTLGRLVSYLYAHMEPVKKEVATGEQQADASCYEITFVLDDELEIEIQEARYLHQKANEDLAFRVLPFNEFGKDRIKTLGISPDSFVQIGIQLAQHKTFGRAFNIYESVMTKQFLHGRTEAMRPVTKEAQEFILSPSTKSLKAASLKHVDRINECKNGHGVDRHLFGLKKIHEKMYPEQPLPAVFNSPGYHTITSNTFSTSTSSSVGMRYAGYGPSVEEGLAVRYLIFNDKISFVLSSWKNQSDLLNQYQDSLRESLKEMASLFGDE